MFTAHGNTYDLSRKEVRSFHVPSSSFYMEVDNKYGDIQIVPWEKDSIKVQVEITVRSQKHHRLQEMMDEINIEFSSTPAFLLVETGWDTDVSFFKKKTYNFKQGIDADDKIQVDQIIHVPIDLTMEIRNRFGNVYMSDHDGALDASVAHGDFRARELNGLKSLDVKFGRLKIKRIGNARISLNSVNSAQIDVAGKLDLETASSDVEIDRVNELHITSKHDEMDIEEIHDLSGTFLLSDLSVKLVKRVLNINCKMGSVHIHETAMDANSIRIDGNKTDISIGLSQTFTGAFDVDVDSKCRLTYSGRIDVESKGVGTEGNEFMKGRIGADSSTLIVVRAEGGYVDVSDQ